MLSLKKSKKLNKGFMENVIRDIFSNSMLFILMFLVGFYSADGQNNHEEDIAKWWRESRFGLFIHWGVYSVPAGVWKGEKIEGIGEQIMRFAAIPNSEYTLLPKKFNPTKFDAKKWVQTAKESGMKYIVITAKHHDGFAMYDSKASQYDIVDATPFGRDIMAELAKECQLNGIRLCFYYSHRQDWHDPNANWQEWKDQYETPQELRNDDFEVYIQEKAFPQVRELLTQYGPIGIIWYDTPTNMTSTDSKRFYDLVKEIQPKTLVNSRVGNGFGDYQLFGDNEIPWKVLDGDYEVIATMNNTWGFKSWDHQWKTPKQLIESLAKCASRGSNYLLNVGPTSEGEIPQASIDILDEMGHWLKINGPSIYGTQPMIFKRDFPWGTSTTKGNKIYLHIFDHTMEQLTFRGLKTPIHSARLLSLDQELKFTQQNAMNNFHETVIELPSKLPEETVSVIELTFDQTPESMKDLYQFSNGLISLPATYAELISGEQGTLSIGRSGYTQDFSKDFGSLQWKFHVTEPGNFMVKLYINRHWRQRFPKGAKVRLQFDDTTKVIELKEDVAIKNVRAHSYPESVCYLSEIQIDHPGEKTIELSVESTGTTIKKWFYDEDLDLELDNLRVLQIELDPVFVVNENNSNQSK